ncbi:MAG: hypothetical protein IPN62_17725 [Flavobacteriales bacterium]|nr:hypothetical protein [Flavobacteriales bacterium]
MRDGGFSYDTYTLQREIASGCYTYPSTKHENAPLSADAALPPGWMWSLLVLTQLHGWKRSAKWIASATRVRNPVIECLPEVVLVL